MRSSKKKPGGNFKFGTKMAMPQERRQRLREIEAGGASPAGEPMVEDLLQRGADPNLILPEGIAAIHLAAGMEQESGTRCLSLILQYGGDPNVRSADDLTPLHVAASWGCCTCLRLLLISGGDHRLEDQDGNTAIDLALEQGNEMCVRILQRYLEKTGEEQNLWIPQRRAESFLTTLTEDFLESAGSSVLLEDDPPGQISRASKLSPNQTLQHMGLSTPLPPPPHSVALDCRIQGNSQQRSGIEDLLSCSLFTEDSQECTTLYNHCKLHDELEPPSSTLFGNMCGNRASGQAAVKGGSDDGLELSTPEAQGGTTQSHSIKSTTDCGCLCPDQNCTFPCAPLTDLPSQKSRASPEVPNANGFPPTYAMQDERKVDCRLGTQDADATLDHSHYSSFLVSDLMVKVTGQEGLDVTSPDHAYFFCRANSTTVSDLEKTVVDLALLSKVYGDPGEHAVAGKSSNGESTSLYNSCNGEIYKTATDKSCDFGTQKCKGKENGVCSSACESNHIGISSLRSQMFLGPSSSTSMRCLGGDVDTPLPAVINRTDSSACSEGMRCLCDRLGLGVSSSKKCSKKRMSEFHSTGTNKSPGNTVEPDLSQLSQDERLHFSDKRKNQGSCTPLSQKTQPFWIPNDSGAHNTAVWEATSSVIGEQTSTHEPQGKLKGSVSSEAWAGLNKKERQGSVQELALSLSPLGMEEKRANLATEDTVPIQRTCALSAGGESSDTMAVAHPTLSAREEEFTDLEMNLRSMLLSTKAYHSPLLQSNQRSCHVTPRTKSRMTASSIHNSNGSSLFDESLEMPSRHRRVRSPKGMTPASGTVKDRTVDLRNENLPCRVQDEMGGLDDTLLIAAVPSSCKQSSGPESSSLGPIAASPASLANCEREVCRDNGQSDVKVGTECSTNLEATCLFEERLPENTEGGCTAQVIPDTVSSWAKSARPRAKCSRANPSRVSFSKLPAGELPGGPGTSSCSPGRLSPISQDVPLSPGGRPVNLNATEPVEYLYVDEDGGHALVERHVPCTDDSIASTTSSEDTIIYDWWAYAKPVEWQSNKENSPVQLSAEVRLLSDDALIKKLRDFGVNPGPVTGLTRNVYMKLLEKLMSDPKTKARKGSAGYTPELCSALETYQIPDGKDDEMVLAHQFDQPDKRRKWREGLLKSSFNYLLLDPRVTQNLPFRCHYTSQAECFRTFVSAIFYVGKGKRSRPYSHLYEALTHYKKSWKTQQGRVCSKVQHILEIWTSGQGVISMHCFQNVIPVEAYTREACMVDAIGLKMLTNQKKGNYYGVVAGWPMKRRRCLGVHLLHRAMQIFLAEGERQLRPTDIRTGQ
ncbi:hypothetical protein lerEdw1_010593 [Lerista edwardsae]|nr:hypothetical protein lerEdw1_010593 [Lerista edwardsae]